MTTYQLATDGDDEPCLFFHRDTYPHWQPVLRRCDLAVSARHLWDDVAAAVVAASSGFAHLNDEKIKFLASAAKVPVGVAQNWLWNLDEIEAEKLDRA